MEKAQARLSTKDHLIILFLGSDVMMGRGIDQILPHPSEPFIPEPFRLKRLNTSKYKEPQL